MKEKNWKALQTIGASVILFLCSTYAAAVLAGFKGAEILGRTMTTREYEIYKSAILAANDSKDKEALRQIQKQLVANYGLDNEDVRQLLKLFAYTV